MLAQRPLLVLPQALLDRLRAGGPEHVLPRVTMRQTSFDEYLKTAQKIKESPWDLKKGASYLESWCEANKNGTQPQPHPVGWIMDPETVETRQKQLPLTDEWKRYAPGPAAKVEVHPAPKKRKRYKQPEEPADVEVPSGDDGQPPKELPGMPEDEPNPPVGPRVPLKLGCAKCRRNPLGCKPCNDPKFRGKRG